MIAVVTLAVFCQTADAGRPTNSRTERDVARLERGLAGSPMAGTARLLVANGRRNHVSPFFMAAVAKVESSLGSASCYGNRRNVWGLASCGDSWAVPHFGSWKAAIRFYARWLAGRWPNHSSPWSFVGYAQPWPGTWPGKVADAMRYLFGVAPETRYP